MRSHPTPAAAALLAETDSSMNSARIKENGASEKTPMQTFIDALPLASPLNPPTASSCRRSDQVPTCTVNKTGSEKPECFRAPRARHANLDQICVLAIRARGIMRPDTRKRPTTCSRPKKILAFDAGVPTRDTPVQHSALSFHLPHPRSEVREGVATALG